MDTGEEGHPLGWISFNSDPFTSHKPHPPLTVVIRAQHSSDWDKLGLSKRQVLCLSKVVSLLECHKVHQTNQILSSPGSAREVFSVYLQVCSVADYISSTAWNFLSALFSQQNFLKDLLEKANKTVDDTKLAEYTDLMVRLNWKRFGQRAHWTHCVPFKSCYPGWNKQITACTSHNHRWAFLLTLHHFYPSKKDFSLKARVIVALSYIVYTHYT